MNRSAKTAQRQWLAIGCALVGVILFQWWGNPTRGYIATNSLFYWWTFQWVNPLSETEHAWLVLGLSVFLAIRNLKRDRSAAAPDDFRAIGAIGVGFLLHVMGYMAQQPRLSVIGLLCFVWGVLTIAGGSRWSRATVFPVGFMVFAIPVNALDSIGFWLRLGVVHAGESIAHFLGIDVVRNGTQIFSAQGHYQYDVAAACSGVRSLIALGALSLVVGYVRLKPWWLRGLLLAFSLPLIFIGNVARIVSIIVAAQVAGQRWGDRVHDIMGFGVFVIVLGATLMVAEWVAYKFPGVAVPDLEPPAKPRAGVSIRPLVLGGLVGASGLFAVSFLAYRHSRPASDLSGVLLAADQINPKELPTFLGSNWMGHHIEPTQVERQILPPDTGFSRKIYVNLDRPNDQVLLSLVLSGTDRTSIHRPELCLVGQGWTIVHSRIGEFTYPGHPEAHLRATILQVHREVITPRGRQLVPNLIAYWFVDSTEVVPTQTQRILTDSWNRLVHGRADRWAYVLLQTSAVGGESAALERMQSVLTAALPAFQTVVN